MEWATFTPRDGIEAEQAGSSPSALHCTVVASEGGLAYCQYSTPVSQSASIGHTTPPQ